MTEQTQSQTQSQSNGPKKLTFKHRNKPHQIESSKALIKSLNPVLSTRKIEMTQGVSIGDLIKMPVNPKKEIFYETIRTKINEDLEGLVEDDLKYLYEMYNEEYFRGGLSTDKPINWKLSRLLTRTAGYCETKNDSYTIALAYKKFMGLFLDEDGPKYYLNGGLNCYTRLEVMLNTFEHELVHLYFTINYPNEKVHHGDQFKDLAYHLFGHTDIRHALDVDVTTTSVTREEIVGWEYVSWTDEKSQQQMIGRIIQLNQQTVSLTKLEDGRKWLIPYERIHNVQPDPPQDLLDKAEKRQTKTVSDFKLNQEIKYDSRGTIGTGKIIKLNPKKAQVQDPSGKVYLVPYEIIL